jgi:hypothetical protein
VVLSPPYVIRVTNVANRPKAVLDEITAIAEIIRTAREWQRVNRGIDVKVSMVIGDDN